MSGGSDALALRAFKQMGITLAIIAGCAIALVAFYKYSSPPLSCWLPALSIERARDHYHYFLNSNEKALRVHIDELHKYGVESSKIEERRTNSSTSIYAVWGNDDLITVGYTTQNGGDVSVAIGSCYGAHVEYSWPGK